MIEGMFERKKLWDFAIHIYQLLLSVAIDIDKPHLNMKIGVASKNVLRLSLLIYILVEKVSNRKRAS